MLPVETSPPKSGCIRRVVPMNEMYADDAGSTGADEMSRFHQLPEGNRGGSGPPIVLAAKTQAPPIRTASSVRTRNERRVSDTVFRGSQAPRQPPAQRS